MHREYHKWFSPRLNRDMELLVLGHGGVPVLIFPTSMGRFFEFEDRGMANTLRPAIDWGRLTLFCVDSVDTESFYCKWAHPSGRIRRHQQYDDYLVHEVVPLMRRMRGSHRVAVAGCSFGAYHAVNFSLRHPDAVLACAGLSGAYDIKPFLDGYYDDLCYFHNPVDSLPSLGDPWFLGQYRHDIRWVLAAGEHDICLDATRRLAGIFAAKTIPHTFECWGYGAYHDWPLWHEMIWKYFGS